MDKGLDKGKGLDKESNKDQDQDKDPDKGKSEDHDSLLARILHKGVLGAFSTSTTDTPTPATALAPVKASALPSSVPRGPLTLNNKGDEENSPVTPLAYYSSYIPSFKRKLDKTQLVIASLTDPHLPMLTY